MNNKIQQVDGGWINLSWQFIQNWETQPRERQIQDKISDRVLKIMMTNIQNQKFKHKSWREEEQREQLQKLIEELRNIEENPELKEKIDNMVKSIKK